ncbi:peroxisomal membrane protein PEX16-like [Diadema antillarum]|uniref:peroxisomal membrane protein PEX16-like n=1 Tax=Diadema antillarum TaxID=105358 RepID=UPI003A85EBC8
MADSSASGATLADLPLPDQRQYIPESMKLLRKLSLKYRETYDWYRKWVTQNPDIVSQVEKTFRVFSYLIAGFTDDSEILSEFVYALANLLVFFNDSIMRNARASLRPKLSLPQGRVIRWLTILDHIEVFFELASQSLWGQTGKWIVITVIEILRTIFRLVLLHHFKAGVQSSPPMQPLNRSLFTPPTDHAQSDTSSSPDSSTQREGRENLATTATQHYPQPLTFEGKRSGRVVRCLHATPDVGLRSWKLPSESEPGSEEEVSMTELAGFSLAAETLFITRPLLHLSCLLVWGLSSWKPWLLSLATDIVSLEMMKRDQKVRLTSKEKTHLVNRRLMLLIYLMRSPCYNVFTRSKLESFLRSTGQSIPCAALLTKPILEYLPTWQKIYFYTWAH